MVPSCSRLSVIDTYFSDISFYECCLAHIRTLEEIENITHIRTLEESENMTHIRTPKESENISSHLTKVGKCNRRI